MDKNKLSVPPLTPLLAMSIFLVGLGLLEPSFAADLPTDGTLDGITSQYQTAAQQFGDRIKSIGLHLLVILGVLQLSINMIMKLLGKIEMEELVAALFKSLITAGIFTFFIQNVGPNMLSIINLFSTAGQTGSGLPELTASGIFNQGLALQTLMVEKFNAATGADGGLIAALRNFYPAMQLTAISVIIILAFAMLAIQMVMVQIELFFVMAVAPILFGFGGLSYTRDIAINAFKSAIASGVKILIIYLVAGVAYTLAQQWGSNMQYVTLTNWWPMWQAMGGALLMAALSLQLPKMAGAIMSGSTSLSAGESAAATIGAAAGVAALGAGAVAGGAAAMSGATGMASGAGAAMSGAKHAATSVADFVGNMRGGGSIKESAGGDGVDKSLGLGLTGASPSSSSSTTSNSAPYVPAPTTEELAKMGRGNASTASIGGSGKPPNEPKPKEPRRAIHDVLKQAESYMPNDGAQGTVPIDHRSPD